MCDVYAFNGGCGLLAYNYIQLYSCTGMFYYVVGNMRPELRSTQRATQLIACVTTPILDKYGFRPILEPFIQDVNTLCKVIWYMQLQLFTLSHTTQPYIELHCNFVHSPT